MKFWAVPYYTLRILKWVLWIAFVGFCAYFVSDRTPHLDDFRNLSRTAEAIMFGLPMAAVIVGLFELMVRDRAYPRRMLERR